MTSLTVSCTHGYLAIVTEAEACRGTEGDACSKKYNDCHALMTQAKHGPPQPPPEMPESGNPPLMSPRRALFFTNVYHPADGPYTEHREPERFGVLHLRWRGTRETLYT